MKATLTLGRIAGVRVALNRSAGPRGRGAAERRRGDGTPVGLVTAAGIDRTPWARRGSTTVAEVMAPFDEVATASPGEPVGDVLPRPEAANENRVLVLDPDGRALVGVLSPTDITRAVTSLSATRDRE